MHPKKVLYLFLILIVLIVGGGLFRFFTPSVHVSKATILGENTFKCEGRMLHYYCYETRLSFPTFERYARQKGWKMKRIGKPFKIMRYTFILGHFRKDYDGLRDSHKNDKTFQETPYSYSHFISEGFYYMEEDSQRTLHVAYDMQNNMLYYYSRTTHGGGDTQKEINPDWDNNELP